jgi:diacylglycerol kinase family enzyme
VSTPHARSFTLLVNPASGGGAAPEAVIPVARALREAGATVEVTYSPGPLAMHALVGAALDRDDVVVSVGGDGMLSSLAGLVSARGGVLGILPSGRGNDFARMLGLPSTPREQAELLLSGRTREVDLIDYAGRLVAGSVYAGVDARASEIVDRARWLPSSLQYPYAAVRSLATYRPGRYQLCVDGAELEVSAATVVVASSGYYGKGMHIAPAALVDDGVLDVVVIEAASKRELIRALPSVYDGRHVERPEVHVLTGRHVELRGTPLGRGAAIPVGGDGEPLGVLPLLDQPPAVVQVLPGALRVIA